MSTGKKTTPKQATQKSKTRVKQAEVPLLFLSRKERIAIGKKLRDRVPRESHAGWKPSPKRRDPIDILQESSEGRVPELIPIRYGRMLRSPFTFMRASAELMAYDLATTPITGLEVQACGDCHLLNFGLFATPERNLVFDINDFDETLPAPWEWDLKRLAASFVVAARDIKFSADVARESAQECVRAYRKHMHKFATMNPLEVWYDSLDARTIIAMAPNEKMRKTREAIVKKAHARVVDNLFPKIATQTDGGYRLVDQPPVIFHPAQADFEERVREALADYQETLPHDLRILFDRYRLEDCAMKVVGVGSVGTRCLIALMFDEQKHPLMLQIKESTPSVLERYTRKSEYENEGQRVVVGQRMMQCASDIFLGWARSRGGKDFFVRQLRDMKMSAPIEGGGTAEGLKSYAELCGWTLARAHAKTGDATTIAAYLGKNDSFDQALSEFAMAYADQNEKDYQALVEAVSSGRLEALIEEE